MNPPPPSPGDPRCVPRPLEPRTLAPGDGVPSAPRGTSKRAFPCDVGSNILALSLCHRFGAFMILLLPLRGTATSDRLPDGFVSRDSLAFLTSLDKETR